MDVTPYELYLLKVGYQQKLEDDWARSKFIAYVTYATTSAANGATPLSFDEWIKPEDKPTVDPSKLKDAEKIDARYKARMEAEMNKIP